MKYKIEKVLHEIIRDLPDAMDAERLFNRGYILPEEALEKIALAMKEERERSRNA